MLNRIYIVVGLLAIIVLAGAFVAPRFIQWGDYRARMEELAGGVLGTPVTIQGEIEFSLLPQPRLTFTDVLVGDAGNPAATVRGVEAEFSLIDFLRDNYNVTRLVLRGPDVSLTVDESGFLGSGVSVAGGGTSVGLGDTTIVDGTVRLTDLRSNEAFVASGIDGDLRLTSFSGPFQFQGAGDFEGQRYGLRLNSSVLDGAGTSRVSAAIRQESGENSFTAEGSFTPGMAPKFDGTLVYRRAPANGDAAEDIRGDMLLESKVTASTDRVVLSGFTLQPDENRAGARLTGAASIQLGGRRSFDAVISGGVFSLPPRDATEDGTTTPYEIVRLLAELPPPPIPPIPGRVGIDLAEVGLRALALRDVRIDASTDAEAWQIEQFSAQLPGETVVRVNGRLLADGDRPAFQGRLTVASQRLDALTALWRKPGEDNPLFNMPGALDAQVMLASDALGLIGGKFTLDGLVHALELRVGFGEEKRLDLGAHFDALGPSGSAAIGALLPNIATDAAFNLTFPVGSMSLSAKSARVLGLDGTELVADGQWSGEGISFSRLSAADWGGIGLNATGSVGGTPAEPDIAGSGVVQVSAGGAPALVALYDVLETPPAWREFLALSTPADLLFDIGSADGQGWQTVTLEGVAGAGELDLRADLSGGLGGLVTEPLRLSVVLEGTDASAVTRQIGLGEATLFGGAEPVLVSVALEGAPTDRMRGQFTASQGEQSVGYSGDLSVGREGEIVGTGGVTVALEEAGGLAEAAGAGGISLPAVAAEAQLHFEGGRLARLTDIAGTSGEVGFAGELSLSRTGSATVIAGGLAVDAITIEGLATTLFGRTALVSGLDVWPEGPIDIGNDPRRTRGSVTVTTPVITAGGAARLGNARFELSWDDRRLRLGEFEAGLGGGRASLDLSVCCSGPLADKTVSGRLSLSGVPLDAIGTPALVEALDGVIEGGVRFEASGSSIADVFGNVAGEGNFTVSGLGVRQMAPSVFPAVAGLGDVLSMEPDALGTIIALALEQNAFTAPATTGAFTMAGGVARLTNLIVEGDGARLAGDLNATLRTLGLDGNFVMTPRNYTDPSGLVGEDTSRILARVAGTALAPEVTLNLEEMVAAIQVRANELEVERLEVLRAEDAERQRAAAEERNRLIEEQRRRAAEEAARLAAEEAARLAAEEEARRLEEEQNPPPAQPAVPTEPGLEGPLDLGLPPPRVNQPAGAGVNQPFFTPLN